MTDIMYDGLVHYDESIYASLARMLNEEPVQPQDPLGIEKGKDFKPDAATQFATATLIHEDIFKAR